MSALFHKSNTMKENCISSVSFHSNQQQEVESD